MKNTLLFLFIIITLQVFSQTHKATYSLKVEANPTTGGTERADEINPLADNNEFYLYFDKTQSYYTSYNVENNTPDMSDALAQSYDPIKHNYQTKTYEKNVQIDRLYRYTAPNYITWTISDESKIIDGYHCIKANGIQTELSTNNKFKIQAWFAPEINYPVGPGLHAGLPGIIAYLTFENHLIFKLEKIKFNDNSINLDKIQYEGEVLSKEKYIEYLKD